jgi:hypothetical protein
VIRALCDARAQKLTFAGGEPTLHPDLPALLSFAKGLGVVTCVVTNGHRLEQLIDVAAGDIDWVGLSVDSADEETRKALGRGRGAHVRRSIAHAEMCRDAGIQLKLNTVVTALTWQEDLHELIRVIQAERWKVLQVLRVAGQNDGRVEPLLVSQDQFRDFVERHRCIVAPTSDQPADPSRLASAQRSRPSAFRPPFGAQACARSAETRSVWFPNETETPRAYFAMSRAMHHRGPHTQAPEAPGYRVHVAFGIADDQLATEAARQVAQLVERLLAERHLALPVVLGAADLIRPGRSANQQPPRFEVDVVPAQRPQLTQSHG